MPDWGTLALFLAATLTLNVTPGPDMLYVIARSAAQGRRAGIVSALGIAGGTIVHTALVALGLSGLLLAVPIAFEIVKLAGAAYLMWLGARLLLRTGGTATVPRVSDAPVGAIFRQGVITNVLNPKVALFFLAFLPQFVDPRRGPIAVQIAALGLLFNVSGTLVNIAVALLVSRAGQWTRRRAGTTVLERASGALFIGLGLRLALFERR